MGIAFISYALCGVAFLALTLLISVSRSRSRYKTMILIACGTSAVWAGMVAASEAWSVTPLAAELLETARAVVWLVVLASLAGMRRDARSGRLTFLIYAAVAVVGVVAAGLTVTRHLGAGILSAGDGTTRLTMMSGAAYVLLAVLGLLLLENLFRNADEDGRWSIKHLCFGLGALFSYDFFLYADAALFNRVDPTLMQARGFVSMLAVPLIAVSTSRSRSWEIDIHVSRKMVFHTAALLGTGMYLLLMAAAGFYLKEVGGGWGPVFQIIFLTGALLILVVIFSSGSFRSRVKVWVSKHFFSYTFDYREEWLRFTQTVAPDERATALHDRIVRAVANITDSTSGGLWVLRPEDHAYLPTARWHFSGPLPDEGFPGEREDSPFVRFLDRTHWIIDLDEFRADRQRYRELTVPGWLIDHPRASLVIPLVHRETLRAFMVLGLPRVKRVLDWETYDLLKAVGGQAASYLAEEQAANALSDAKRLEDFNRRFAFIVHDIKNVVGQMSLMLKNAERYGDNPEFQKDMLATVGNSVVRMKELLEQFKAERAGPRPTMRPEAPDKEAVPVPLGPLLARVTDRWHKQKTGLEVDIQAGGVAAVIDEDTLASVLDHLMQNAIEAAGEDGHVALRQASVGGEAVIEVEDDGPGMDAEFIRNQLFRPLDTAKPAGYGLGAYQARQLVREMGGRLEVSSTPGKGTVMRVVLPVAESSRVVRLDANRSIAT